MKGLVTKKIANHFVVDGQNCLARGNLKNDGIFVGDMVEYDKNQFIIEKVFPRKNLLIRPPLANIDKMFIVVAPLPKPDFLLIDKLIIFCQKNKIKVVICVNKCDILSLELKNLIQNTYSKFAKVIFVSAQNNQIEQLKSEIDGICAFAGQSAVGKSSLLNALFGEQKEQIGTLAKRTARGKQTTRIVSLYKFGKGFIADTAGFSKLDEGLLQIDERHLADYYPDFQPYLKNCEYLSCTHTNEQNCGIKKQVAKKQISSLRYENYLKIYQGIKEKKRYEKKG